MSPVIADPSERPSLSQVKERAVPFSYVESRMFFDSVFLSTYKLIQVSVSLAYMPVFPEWTNNYAPGQFDACLISSLVYPTLFKVCFLFYMILFLVSTWTVTRRVRSMSKFLYPVAGVLSNFFVRVRPFSSGVVVVWCLRAGRPKG